MRTLLRSRVSRGHGHEDKVVRLGPLGGVLVLAEELDQVRLKADLAEAGGGFGGGDVEQAAV